MIKNLEKEIKKLSTPAGIKKQSYFFKTGKGEYAEKAVFLGVSRPQLRKLGKEYRDLTLEQTKKHLIQSKYHDKKSIGLLILVEKYTRAKTDAERNVIYKTYVSQLKFINNWDLVDTTSPHVLGRHLLNSSRKILYTWVKSKNLWIRRVAIVSTWWFIRQNDVKETFKLAKLLLKDKEDLIHKATGWMLREAGKKDEATLIQFLEMHAKVMPRTMLRYSIERFSKRKRKYFLDKK